MRGLAHALEQSAYLLRHHTSAEAQVIMNERIERLTGDLRKTEEGINFFIEQQITGYRQVLNAMHISSLNIKLPIPVPRPAA